MRKIQLVLLIVVWAGVLFVFGCIEENAPIGTGAYPVVACGESDACPDDATCSAGLCVPACAADADCPEGAACIDGVCDLAAELDECSADDECPVESACVDGVCVYEGSGCDPDPEICDGLDNDCDGEVDEEGCDEHCVDNDGDGFGVGDGCEDLDCDDDDATIGPGTAELCDGLDNDCDGEVDEDVCSPDCAADDECDDGDPMTDDSCDAGVCRHDPTGSCTPEPEICDGLDNDCDGEVDEEGCGGDCVDMDGDGYGIGDGDCAGLDCDDLDASVNPGALEICDGLDNDCDGMVDEEGCGIPCATHDDCDDGDPTTDDWCDAGVCRHDPTGTCTPEPEICDGLDNDCDGMVDEEGCGGDCVDMDGDGYGIGDGDCAGLDCDDLDASVNPGALEICDGLDNDCDGEVDEGLCGAPCADDADCEDGDPSTDDICMAGACHSS